MAVNSATSMLPPIRTPSLHLGPCNGSGASSGGPRLSGATSQGNCYDTQAHLHSPPGLRSNSSTTSDSGTPPANLTEESMMVLSQSIDSIHTMGTSGGSESLDHQVRTLFVSGLPLDTKSRELYLLFRGFKGYLSSTLKPAGKNGKLTAPVGFVTFESREQAEKALSKLQGVKFDPECNQHMRLEFARSNTKVTKPKCGGLSIGFPFAPMGSSPNTAAANLSPLPQPAAFPGVVTSTFLPHLAGFDPTMALIAAQDAANQWSNPAFGYDTSGLFSSVSGAQGLAPAALLQASNFRAILPMNAGGGSAAGLGQHNLQLVQAALAQANAAAALGLITGTPTGPPPPPPQPQQQAPPTPSNSGALRTLGSPTGTPLSLGMTAQQAVTPSTAAAAFAVQFHNQQILAAQLAQQQQQQQQQQQNQNHQQEQRNQSQPNSAAAMAAAAAAAAASGGLPVNLFQGAVGLFNGGAYNALMRDETSETSQHYVGQSTPQGKSMSNPTGTPSSNSSVVGAAAHSLSF